MKFTETDISDLFIIEPKVYQDERGYFFESFRREQIHQHIGPIEFVQENESKSSYGVLRGLHFQIPPYAQSKLVRVVQGKALDVAVDLRNDSQTFKQHKGVILSAENKKQYFIPQGFAHGFVVLSNTAVVQYKVDNYYSSEHERGIIFNDAELGIDWRIPQEEIVLSEKDKRLLDFEKAVKSFKL